MAKRSSDSHLLCPGDFEEKNMSEQDEDLKRIFVCESELQARQAKEFLEANGFKAMVRGLDVGGSVFGGAVDDPEIEIFIKASDFEDAKALVESMADDESEPVPPWTCDCGEDVDEGFEICWSCGAIYGNEEDDGSEESADSE